MEGRVRVGVSVSVMVRIRIKVRVRVQVRFTPSMWGKRGLIQGHIWARSRRRGLKRYGRGCKRGAKNVKSRTRRTKQAKKTRFKGGGVLEKGMREMIGV